jgi:hypothetical protein
MIEIKTTVSVTMPDGEVIEESFTVKKANRVTHNQYLIYAYADTGARKAVKVMIKRFKDWRKKGRR